MTGGRDAKDQSGWWMVVDAEEDSKDIRLSERSGLLGCDARGGRGVRKEMRCTQQKKQEEEKRVSIYR